MTEVAPAPRPRSRFRKIAIVFAIVSLFVLILVWFAPSILLGTGLKDRVLKSALPDLQGQLTIDGGRAGWFRPVELHNLKLHDAEGREVLAAEKLSTTKSLYQLLTNPDDLGTITLTHPHVRLVVANKSTNLEEVLRKYLDAEPKPETPDRVPVNLEVLGGKLSTLDTLTGTRQELTDISCSVMVPRARSQPITIQAEMTSTLAGQVGKARIKGSLLNEGEVSIVADQFALSQIQGLVRRLTTDIDLQGMLAADTRVVWGRDPKQRMKLNIQGWAHARDLRAASARWLKGDTLRFEKLQAGDEAHPIKLSVIEGHIQAEHAQLVCDVGAITAAGHFDPDADAEQLLNEAGLTLKADVDLARLGALIPKALHLREGTELRKGTIHLELSSTAGPPGQAPLWRGIIDTTTLEAVREGKSIQWNQPIKLTFLGRFLPGFQPQFDDLTLQSDFIGLRARGTLTDFQARTNLRLDLLAGHLADFVDMNGTVMDGSADMTLVTKPADNGQFSLDCQGKIDNLVFVDKNQNGLREKVVTVKALGTGTRGKDGALSVQSAEAVLNLGSDQLALKLEQPLNNLKFLDTVQARARLSGDLTRWRQRVGTTIGFPARWQLAGNADAAGRVTWKKTGPVDVQETVIQIQDARFVGAGLNLNEPELIGKGHITYDPATKALTFRDTTLSSLTIGASTKQMEITPDAQGEYGVVSSINFTTNLARLQKTLRIESTPGSAINGKANGTVRVDMSRPNTVAFITEKLRLEQIQVGNPPSWTEENLAVQIAGDYRLDTEALNFSTFQAEREGLAIAGKGTLSDLSGTVLTNLQGTISYDLARLEPTLKKYLGKSAAISGKETRPFALSGPLTDGGKNLSVAVGTPRSPLDRMTGNASLGWKTLRAYGFDVEAADVKATLEKGVIDLSPIEARFAGGKVRVDPQVTVNSGNYDLSIAQGKVIDRAALSPAVLSDALGYALPAIANAAQAEGTLSFDVGENRIPLADPERGLLLGNLTIHSATVSPGPVISQILETTGMAVPKLKLTENQVVPIALVDGRVTHKDFAITVDTVTLKSSGSVGLDGSLRLQFAVPVNEKMLAPFPVLKDRPRVREALAKQTLTIQVAGTLQRPTLDQGTVRAAIVRLVDGAVRDASRGAIDDVLKGGLDKLPFPIPFGPKK